MASQGSREKGVFSANRFRLGGIALLILAWVCVAAPASAQAVTVTVDNPSVVEGDAGTTDMTFQVTLTSVEANDVTIEYETSPGFPADPQDDFSPVTGELTFVAANGETDGQTSKSITVPIVGDTTDEPTEYFELLLRGTGLVDAPVGVGEIVDNDLPTLTIDDVVLYEGPSGGTTTAEFTVTASSTNKGDITVDYATADGTATAPSDYTAVPATPVRTLTFPEFGELTQKIQVTVIGDSVTEPNETFQVNLTNATNATISQGTGHGTIRNGVDPSGPPPPPPPPVTPDVTPNVIPADPDDDDSPAVQARVLRGLSLVPSRRRVKRSSLVRLKGVLRASNGPATCRSHQKIAIQRRRGRGRYQTFDVAITTKTGKFKVSTRPVRTYVYRARVSQTARCMGAASKWAKVAVRNKSKGGSARR
jgi:hypothetical protein